MPVGWWRWASCWSSSGRPATWLPACPQVPRSCTSSSAWRSVPGASGWLRPDPDDAPRPARARRGDRGARLAVRHRIGRGHHVARRALARPCAARDRRDDRDGRAAHRVRALGARPVAWRVAGAGRRARAHRPRSRRRRAGCRCTRPRPPALRPHGRGGTQRRRRVSVRARRTRLARRGRRRLGQLALVGVVCVLGSRRRLGPRCRAGLRRRPMGCAPHPRRRGERDVRGVPRSRHRCRKLRTCAADRRATASLRSLPPRLRCVMSAARQGSRRSEPRLRLSSDSTRTSRACSSSRSSSCAVRS